MHLAKTTFYPERYPTREYYPFNVKTFHDTKTLSFFSPVTFFVGENGAGKSTLLKALCHKCEIHIWRQMEGARVGKNPYEEHLFRYMEIEWSDGTVPGSFFSGEIFRDFALYLDEWAVRDPGMLKYFGGKSLISKSHGQSLMSYFRNRYRIKGLYLLDEPETALSPRSQLELLRIMKEMSQAGHAQFIIASHSPILMACPGADIYNFDVSPITPISYEETDYYRMYRDFMLDRSKYL